MAKYFGIDFAPVKIPLKRRVETFMVLAYSTLFFAPLWMCVLFLVAIFTPAFWAAVGYGMWIYYDVNYRHTSSRGGRRWEWLRHNAIWRHLLDYFPATLMKTVDLDPDRNYVFGSHPHGILGVGSFGNFAPEASGFSKLFPGIRPHLLTLKTNFSWPILRAVLMWMGVCDVSRDSIRYILTKQGKGNAAIIVVGGAEEALFARPGNYQLKLKNRKGFIKMAIIAGASLVPVYTFGENDLFAQVNNPEGSWLRAFQEKFKHIFGFSPPLYYGRGIFNYTFGPIPHRIPIYTITGRPVHVTQLDEPTKDDVNRVHASYIAELKRLFDENNPKYGKDKTSDKTLEFV